MSIFTFFNNPAASFFHDDLQDSIFDDIFANHSRALHSPRGQGQQQIESSNSNDSRSVSRSFRPRLDVYEGPNNTITATFELPGLRKEDVSIEVHNNLLTVSGESSSVTENKSEGQEDPSGTWHIRERRFGQFSRTIKLPEGVDAEKIKASHADGVLTVTFPKAASEEQAPKRITVS